MFDLVDKEKVLFVKDILIQLKMKSKYVKIEFISLATREVV